MPATKQRCSWAPCRSGYPQECQPSSRRSLYNWATATRMIRPAVVRKNCVGHKFAAATFERKGIIGRHPSNRSQIRSFPATDRGAPDIDTRREFLLPFRASQCRQTVPAVRQARRHPLLCADAPHRKRHCDHALDGSISSNMAIVPNTNGKVDAYTSGLTQLILDISSYFAP